MEVFSEYLFDGILGVQDLISPNKDIIMLKSGTCIIPAVGLDCFYFISRVSIS